MCVEVVLPSLNEADALPTVIGELPAGFAALVVDNGSTDGTAQVAVALGARVVHEPRHGYGAAVHTGLEWASSDLVEVLDADGSDRLGPYSPNRPPSWPPAAPTWRWGAGSRPGRSV